MKGELLIVGTVAYDTIETPSGKREKVLGGSGLYASLSASFFSNSFLFSTVGYDFKDEDLDLISKKNINVNHIKKLKDEKTFYWEGSYLKDLNNAETKKTELNALLKFETSLPASLRKIPYLFLANIDPELQKNFLNQMENLAFVALDTMNYWIETKRDEIFSLFDKITFLFVNETELKLLSQENNLYSGALKLLNMGLKGLVVKRGEYGSVLFYNDRIAVCPAYPLDKVIDPTGAGDTFAGAFVGYLAKEGLFSFHEFKKALKWGTILSSFCVSDFSIDALMRLTFYDLAKRILEFEEILI